MGGWLTMGRTALACIAAAAALCVAGSAGASVPSVFMTTTGQTTQPIGHYEFCREHAAECTPTGKRPWRVLLTPDTWMQLIAIDTTVNRTIRDISDQDQYGRPEVWAYPDSGEGDCEDFALLKRRDLMARGWPASALLMTVVIRANGEGHAVLTVLTDRGDLILDNLTDKVKVWDETDYRYVKRQSTKNPGLWERIDDNRDAAAPLTSATQ
jgi:predicted transglutaminase-like cysteine proteinase